MRMIKAILIDPFEKTVTEVELDGDDFHEIYPLISRPDDQVGTFTLVQLPNGDGIYVDDEGLINWFERAQAFFEIDGGHQPLAGKGLVLGVDAAGDSVSARTTLEQMRLMTRFITEADLLAWIDRGEQ